MLQALNSCLPKHYWTISSWRNVVFFPWSCASYLFKTRLPRPRLQRQAMKHRKKNHILTADNMHGMVQYWMQSMYREGRDGWSLWRSIKINKNLGASLMFLLEINSSEGQLHFKLNVSVWASGWIFFLFFVGKCITFYAIFWEVGFFHIQV